MGVVLPAQRIFVSVHLVSHTAQTYLADKSDFSLLQLGLPYRSHLSPPPAQPMTDSEIESNKPMSSPLCSHKFTYHMSTAA